MRRSTSNQEKQCPGRQVVRTLINWGCFHRVYKTEFVNWRQLTCKSLNSYWVRDSAFETKLLFRVFWKRDIFQSSNFANRLLKQSYLICKRKWNLTRHYGSLKMLKEILRCCYSLYTPGLDPENTTHFPTSSELIRFSPQTRQATRHETSFWRKLNLWNQSAHIQMLLECWDAGYTRILSFSSWNTSLTGICYSG